MADGDVSVEFHGVESFLRLSKALKEAGRTELRKELHAAMRRAAKPLTAQTQAALVAGVPARLAARAGKTKQTVQVATGADPGIRIVMRYGRRGAGLGASNARLLNRGAGIRHPLFGNRDHWYTTPVPAATRWFDAPLEAGAPRVRHEIEQAVVNTANHIAREAGHG